MTTRVLVTGATGFIGRHTLPILISKGFEVHAVSRSGKGSENGVTWHKADLLDTQSHAELMENVKPSIMLNMAWYAEHGKFWASLENFRWVQASLNLARVFQESGGKRIVCAGTCAEYDWNFGVCVENKTPTNPATPYGICKNGLRDLLESYAKLTRMSFAWGRIFFLYGPAEHPSRLVSSVILSLLKGEPARCSHGEQVRDFMYVEDVASAFVALLESDVEGPVNIADGTPVAIKDLLHIIADKIGRPDLLKLGAIKAKENDPPVLTADVTRLNGQVGWQSRLSLEEGIAKTIESYSIKGTSKNWFRSESE